MKSQKCRLILLTGEKHSGKTAFLQKLVKKLKKERFRIAGFTAPSVYKGAFLLGFDLVDIRSRKKAKLARRKLPSRPLDFFKTGLQFGRKILRSAETKNADLIIIDEFGPMELQGKGWRKEVESLLNSAKGILVLVVRRELAEKVKKLFCKKIKVEALSANKAASSKKLIKFLKEMNMDKERMYKEIKKHSKEGKITCRKCFEIAGSCNVPLKMIGTICNEKKFRITACQLGCFK